MIKPTWRGAYKRFLIPSLDTTVHTTDGRESHNLCETYERRTSIE